MAGERKPEIITFPRTDAGNAELFTSRYGSILRFDHRRRRWLEWGGNWWRPDVDAHVYRLAKEAARYRYERAGALDHLKERETEARWAIQSESRSRIEATLALASTERPITDAGDKWDIDPWLLAVSNGVVDLKTGELRPGRQDDRITMHSPVNFDSQAECPRWESFIREVFGENEELVDYIWRATGYSLTGDTAEQCHFICWGPGANGKTTFQRVQREILGDYAANTPFSTLEASSRYSIPNDLAALYAVRLVTASELNESVRLNEARLKMLAGEDPVSARFLHSEFFMFIPVAKFWLSVNHKPVVSDDSAGFWRKIRLIPFTQSFEGRGDRTLKQVLREEYAGILAWMVRGCLEWQRRGLEPPETVRAATAAYRAESDPVGLFIQERCITGPDLRVGAGELYRAYHAWAEDGGLKERERLSNTRFGRLMGERFEKKQQSKGIVYLDIGLLTPDSRAANRPGMDGFTRDDPPFSGFSSTVSLTRENWKNHPQPSIPPSKEIRDAAAEGVTSEQGQWPLE